jgi:hypothetical protein
VRTLFIVVLLLAGPMDAILNADPVVLYDVTSTGGEYQYNYLLSGVSLLQNQELDIAFDPALYGQISDGVSPAGYDLLLFQPNEPPGASGDYSLLALTNNPTTVGTFSVDFTYLGTGAPPAQQFFIYDDNTDPLQLLASGVATEVASDPVPEPSSLWLCCVGIMAGVGLIVRRKVTQEQ